MPQKKKRDENTAWELLQGSHSGSESVVVGSGSKTRPLVEEEAPFQNT
jgi:hypothetical protein